MTRLAWTWLGFLLAWLALREYWPFYQMTWGLTSLLLYGAMVVAAVLLIGGKLRYLIDQEDAIYRDGTGGWRWDRAWLGAVSLIAMWGLSIGLAAAMGAVGVQLRGLEILPTVLVVQVVLVGLGQELFFREAAIKVAEGRPGLLVMMAVLGYGLIHWHGGGLAIMAAMGAGAVYLGARLAGVPILVVALMHGVSSTVFTHVVWIAPDAQEAHAILFMLGCFVIAGVLVAKVGPPRSSVLD